MNSTIPMTSIKVYLLSGLLALINFVSFTAFGETGQNLDVLRMREESRRLYDRIYPYYIEAASMTRVQEIGSDIGGSAGHATVFIKGLCRDLSRGYPRVKVCEGGCYTPEQEAMGIGYNNILNPNAGLGFSVNKEYRNVNWVATPGKDLMYDGGLAPGKPLTRAYMEELADRMVELGTHRGIKLHPEYEIKRIRSTNRERDIVRNSSMGTDFAINFGRHAHIVRVPITPSQLQNVVNYLNELNDRYFVSENYHWSGLTDNCTHFVHNVLAAAGAWPAKDVTTTLWQALWRGDLHRFAIPGNRLIRLAEAINLSDLGNVRRIYEQPNSHRAMAESHWLLAQHGGLIDILPAVEQPRNEVYKIHDPDAIMVMPVEFDPFIKSKARRLARDPRFMDHKTKLLF
ncbi:MAG: hypothetical protein IT289_04580, partial [Oligoflexia bacterium]|nr:hypothetical protein [Oligoflexia bacterium]